MCLKRSLINSMFFRHLPYTSPDGLLTAKLHNSNLHISVDGGKAQVSFSPNDDYFLVEMNRRLHNASMGLLGDCLVLFTKMSWHIPYPIYKLIKICTIYLFTACHEKKLDAPLNKVQFSQRFTHLFNHI